MNENPKCSVAMIDAICASLRNYFVVEIVDGEYTVTDREITLPFLAAGQFFRVVGSVFCDGVYRCGDKLPADETFDGAIWAMAIPPTLEELAAEIEEWKAKNADVLASPYQSESFGGYSYTKGSDSASWQGVFAKRLNRWRKL